jgi:predicted nucleic acid-binding protein
VSVVADTSVWVSYLRIGADGPAAALDGLLAGGQVLMCGPVAAELLAGTPSHRRPELWTLLAGLGWADLRREHWHEIGETAARLRELGQTVPLTDVAIAVAASASNSKLWTDDSDFDRIEQVLTRLDRYTP